MTKAEIQEVRALADKRERDERGLFIAEGEKLIAEIIESGLRIERIYTTEDIFSGRAELVSPKEMERISQLKSHSNSLAVVHKPRHKRPHIAPADKLTLALDGVQNPGNLGTIIRLADWFGIGDIYCSEECADCFNPKVIQATMGAILRVRVHYLPLVDLLQRSASEGVAIWGTMLDGENIYTSEIEPRGVIVMGNEGKGISPAVARVVTRPLLIPPYPADRVGSESLNVAIATGIVCAEFRRRG